MPITHILKTKTRDEIETEYDLIQAQINKMRTSPDFDPDDEDYEILVGRDEDFFIAILNLEKRDIEQEGEEDGRS
jgi:hypothetical protein